MTNNIINGDCVEILKNISNDTINLCITSPPYKTKGGYSDKLMVDTFKEIYRVLKPNSLFFLNFGSLAEDKFRPFKVCSLALDSGFKLNDTIIWIKNHYKPVQGKRRLNNLTEFIFLLYKGKMPIIDRLSIGIPYKDKSNINRFNKGLDLKCGGNVFFINYPTINKSEQKLHNDRYPLELPERCIKLSELKSGIVLDPFSGSGTTCLAAKKLGLNYIGIDKNSECVEISKERLIEEKMN